MEKMLDVKNLVISFRTSSGRVRAVRDICFELGKGETLAIVGESGSGKSVTSKAIIGILAGNSIVEGGEIIYDGKDLLKIPEDEFYRIRGDKIAMIFQDPLSSLNPIMKIGKQLTEAMLLKGKARQKSSRKTFNTTLAMLNRAMIEALAADNIEKADKLTAKCKNFDKFEFKHIELELAYNDAHESAVAAIDEIKNTMFLIEKNAFNKEQHITISEIKRLLLKTQNKYVADGEEYQRIAACANVLSENLSDAIKAGDYSSQYNRIKEILPVLEAAEKKEAPNFFTMGYYLTFSDKPLPDMPVPELNTFMRKYLDDNFMLDFIDNACSALAYNASKHYDMKAFAVNVSNEVLPVFSAENLDEDTCRVAEKKISGVVEQSIDRLEIAKDSTAYTFKSALHDAINTYFHGIKNNVPEQRKHDRMQAKFDRLVESGKNPDWRPVPAAIVDLDLAKENICRIITKLRDHYIEQLKNRNERKYKEETIAMIDYLKLNASGVVLKVTKKMAKLKALKLMEEVGIPEPRRRFNQYPFEFSGGMRQRIVIAIALAANPDILICDEPTTALDVTIQAQILELINKLKAERQLSIIFITHDLGVVANMADRIAVMYAGKIVEYGTAHDIFYSPAHPYTWALLSSMPDLDTKEKLEAIPGTPPNMIYPPVGDAFAERNKYAMQIDFEQQPPMFEISDTHRAATWLLHPNAPKVDPPKVVTDRIARMKAQGGNSNV